MAEKSRYLPRAHEVYKKVATLGYNGAVEWYMNETQRDVSFASYKVAQKIFEASLDEVKDLIDIDVCRGVWGKYLTDEQVAEIVQSIMKFKPSQRKTELSLCLWQLNIPYSEYFMIDAFYYAFPELRQPKEQKDDSWIMKRLQINNGGANSIKAEVEGKNQLGEVIGELTKTSENTTSDKPKYHSYDMVWFGIIALVCCAIACAICDGWDLTGMDKPDGMLRNPGLKWVVASIAGLIVWLLTLAVGKSYWIPKVKSNPAYILLMIPVLLGGSMVVGYIAHLIALLIVILCGLIFILFGFIFSMFG